jgi:hypothetical protein
MTFGINLTITETAVLQSLRTFLLQILPTGTEVVRGLQNRVAMPQGASVVMTPLIRTRLSTNTDTWSSAPDADTLSVYSSKQIDVQLDCYGPGSGDNAEVIFTLFRDQFAFAALTAGGADIAPLFTTPPRQMTFINGEDQYEERWMTTVSIEMNPIVTVTQDFASVAAVDLISVDATYPP